MFERLLRHRRSSARSRASSRRRSLGIECLEDRRLLSNYYVAPRGKDTNPGTLEQPFATIRHALAAAEQPGDHVIVRKGTYREHLVLPHGGTAEAGPLVLENYPGERPILSGFGLRGGNMILVENLSYVVIRGFDIRNNTRVSDGSGIRILGEGANIEISNNKIHDMRGRSAMGITVYGTSDVPISNLIVDRNEIYNIQAAPSEVLTLNGNVTDFQITNNRVHDVNNIGIDMIGGEADIHPTQVARNGLVKGNVVYRARSNYGGGFAAGIYVDGGRDIVIDGNVVCRNNVGIEVGAENPGIVASGVVVQNNLIYWNDKAGLGFGGYDKDKTGRVEDCTFINNTVYKNDTRKTGFGQLWIQYASQNTVANNIFWASANNKLVDSWDGNVDNVLDNNLWYTEAPSRRAVFTWNGQRYASFASYQTATQQDAHSLFADPKFVKRTAANFHLSAASPAINAGGATPGQFAPTDFDGRSRPQGERPCIGAYEYTSS